MITRTNKYFIPWVAMVANKFEATKAPATFKGTAYAEIRGMDGTEGPEIFHKYLVGTLPEIASKQANQKITADQITPLGYFLLDSFVEIPGPAK